MKKTTFEELEKKVIKWGEEKGIFDKATPLTQIAKTREELEETEEAIEHQSRGYVEYVNKKLKLVNTNLEIKDGFGDQLVTLILGMEMQGLTLVECLESAYNVISKRTGKMINGQFVKDE